MTKNNQEKKNIIILISGSIALCFAYIIFLTVTSYLKMNSYIISGIATMVFSILYFSLFIFIKNKNTYKKRINKKLIRNTFLFIAPFVLAVVLYFVTKNIVVTLFVFMICEIAYTIYYNNFVPVPGYKRAYKLYLSGQKQLAIEILNTILIKYPNSFETYTFLGSIYIKNEEYQKAIEYLEKGTYLRPEDYITNINLAIAYTAIENFDGAIESSKQAIKIQPENWNSYYSIALCNLLKNNNEEAKTYFEKVLKFNIPKAQRFLVHYGYAKSLKLLNKEKESIIEFDKALKNGNEQIITQWDKLIRSAKDKPTKPSLFVKEAIEYITGKIS